MALSKIGSAGLASGAVEAADIADGAITSAKLANPNVFMGRNRIINGDMRIDQRNAGAAVTSSGSYPVDRFFVNNASDGAFSAQQDSSAPSGFVNSLKYTTTTADASLSASQFCFINQWLEGTNVADLAWGTANAKTVTLSFWVRSSLTGTFGGALRNGDSNRSYPFTYTISVADTWEYKTVTIPGDTSGTWLTTTGRGMACTFGLGVGTDFSNTAGAWAGGSYVSTTGAVSVIGTLNATWYITGVQLEVGSVATDFERRLYGTELALCQRYFQRYTQNTAGTAGDSGIAMLANWNTTSAYTALLFQQTMRAGPTVSFSSTSHFAVLSAGSSWTPDGLIVGGASINSTEFYANRNSASWTAGYSSWLRITNSAGYIQLSAEL